MRPQIAGSGMARIFNLLLFSPSIQRSFESSAVCDVFLRNSLSLLQVALYCRHELNVRSTSHLLLAFGSLHEACRPFLRRYFAKAIVLPTDWTAIADYVQTFFQHKGTLKPGALPAILRKCMLEKFQQFDAYQLAKHDKKAKGDIPLLDDVEEEENQELAHKRFSIKRLIRLLHINSPVFHVMAILGKKYPNDYEDFRQSGLPGDFEPEQAGKRLKLPIPITWETQISK